MAQHNAPFDGGLGGGPADSTENGSDPGPHSSDDRWNDPGNSDNRYSLGVDYKRGFSEIRNRALEWMTASGFERATGLREEIESLKNIQRLKEGQPIFNEQNLRPSRGRNYLVEGQSPDNRYNLGADTRLGPFEHTQPWADLYIWATAENFIVTRSNEKSGHNKNSAHYKGRAIDVRTRTKTKAENDAMIEKARSLGLRVRDERTRPAGQKVWDGPHLHIEMPGAAPNRIQQREGSVRSSGTRLRPR